MRSTHCSLAVLSSLLLNACVSTLPPGKATYTFERQCLPESMELRRMPVILFESPEAASRSTDRSSRTIRA